IGVTTDSAQFGVNAGMASATSQFSPFAEARVQALLDATYKGFKDHVAAGRHMSPDAVDAVAKGRVWTGADAKAHGLVDALGGYGTALRLAREAAGIAPEAPVALTLFPREKPPIELLYDRLTGKQRRSTGRGAFGRAIEAVEPLLLRIDALIEPPGTLSMPPIGQPQ
ncbi:MAG: S49 family peptidase, partial [Stellaceae bacterium]